AFGKTLLTSIRQTGVSGVDFPGNEHRFEYHDEVRVGGAYDGFAEAIEWSPFCAPGPACPRVDVEQDPTLPVQNLPDARTSAIATDTSHSISTHSFVGAGTAGVFLGVVFGFAANTSNGGLQLLDVDGDG